MKVSWANLENEPGRHTLTHKVLQVMPLNIVRKITNVDPAVLLGVLAQVAHHVIPGLYTIFVRPGGSTIARVRSSSQLALLVHRRPRPPPVVPIGTTRSVTARRIGSTVSAASWASGPATTRRSRPLTLQVVSKVLFCHSQQTLVFSVQISFKNEGVRAIEEEK